ncbi:MAG: endonuclease III [Kiritimatiellae bacterium]|nr:endonuclease III [Kiritimatiellia bacterium]
MTAVRSIREVHAKLATAYGPLPRIARKPPLDSLIETILSQNTSDVNSGRAFASLRRAFPRWDQVERAKPAAIARAIRQGGLAQVKSVVIKRALQAVRAREGRLSLECLRRMSNQEVRDYLLSLPGVGIKTASCVLLFSLGRAVFPVDTHVFRTTRRLGWLPERVKVDDATAYLDPRIPERLRFGLHIYLVWHGRRTCPAHNPRCAECPISRHCRAYRTKRFLR